MPSGRRLDKCWLTFMMPWGVTCSLHDDVIKWTHFPSCWPFVRVISAVTGEFPAQRPVSRSFDVFFDLCLNQQLSKQWRRRWFETSSRSLWRHCNVIQVAWHTGRWTLVLRSPPSTSRRLRMFWGPSSPEVVAKTSWRVPVLCAGWRSNGMAAGDFYLPRWDKTRCDKFT